MKKKYPYNAGKNRPNQPTKFHQIYIIYINFSRGDAVHRKRQTGKFANINPSLMIIAAIAGWQDIFHQDPCAMGSIASRSRTYQTKDAHPGIFCGNNI